MRSRERERKGDVATNLLERELRLSDLESSEQFVRATEKQVPECSSSLEVGFGRVVDEGFDTLLQGEDVSKNLRRRKGMKT